MRSGQEVCAGSQRIGRHPEVVSPVDQWDREDRRWGRAGGFWDWYQLVPYNPSHF